MLRKRPESDVGPAIRPFFDGSVVGCGADVMCYINAGDYRICRVYPVTTPTTGQTGILGKFYRSY